MNFNNRIIIVIIEIKLKRIYFRNKIQNKSRQVKIESN